MSCKNRNCPFHYTEFGDGPMSTQEGETRCQVAEATHAVKFRKGQALFMQGQPSASLYSLASGMVKICTHTPEGREQIIGLSHPGNLLVGLQSIAEDDYAYSATAATHVRACKIDHAKLLHMVRERGDVAMSLIRALNAQLAHSRALMEVMGHKSAGAKIASLILLMVPKSQHDNTEFSLPFSRLEIASLLNLSEETVCRQMADMKRSGIIRSPRRFVAILEWARLRALADGPVA
jgi:CRP-like cAMP-binding protein